MKAVYFVVTALVGVVMFWVGFQLRPVLDPWEQQEVAAVLEDESVEVQQTEQAAAELAAQGYLPLEELTVRIDDGDVQWFDGTMWHTVASMEELAKEDKFCMAQEDFLEFEEQLKQQWENRRAEQESSEEWGETLLVGQKVEPKPTEKPKPTVTAPGPVTAPGSVPGPAAAPESNDSNSGGDNSGGGGGNTGDSGNSGGGNSGGGNPGSDAGGNTGSDSDTGNNDSGGDTGDGENMEWSDDYL